MGNLQHTTCLLAILAAALTAPPAPGASIEGVTFAPEVSVHGSRLSLRGYALLRYKYVFKGYVAALYTKPDTASPDVLTSSPKRLEIEYFWSIGADDFRAATIEGISRNVSEAKLDALRPSIDRFNRLYEDVQPGDRYSLSFHPDHGTELALNGTPRGSVDGEDFAAAIFAIWLGSSPLDQELKTALLGS